MRDYVSCPTPSVPYSPPLCVDLDGTLIRSDTLFETLALTLRHHPASALLIPIWALQGKAQLKHHLAERASFDPASLPYNQPFLSFLIRQRAAGRSLILATAADRQVAQAIADHLNLFDAVVASESGHNLKGVAKSDRLRQLYPNGFDYAGDSQADLPVWQAARHSILVNVPPHLERAVRSCAHVEATFQTPQPSTPERLLRAFRIHQWAKNLLVFVPLITSHRLADPGSIRAALLAFAAFCMCASGVYIANDILDLEADRRHAAKKHRPFASGDLPLSAGFALFPLLMLATAVIARLLPPPAQAVIFLYFFATCLYSLYFKRRLLLDVFTLSALYTIRIVAGHVATGILLSPWLLSFSVFLFLSLAFSKRVSELHSLRKAGASLAHGRGYNATDLDQLNILGIASGFAAALVFALYINSEIVRSLYPNAQLLWLIFPLLLYWICRIWIVSSRGKMHEDPIVFAVRDRVTRGVLLIVGFIVLSAARGWFPLPRLFL